MKSSETIKQPTEVIIMRGLSSEITEKSIKEGIEKFGYFPEYVRIIKDRSTGISKGIAIIKFISVEYSKSFYEAHSTLEIDGSVAWIDFGFEHSSDDWICKYCQNINFNHRNFCFKCSKIKSSAFDVHKNVGNDDISNLPTRFLLIRNLESDMTPQKIFDKVFLFENNLKRVWLLLDCKTLKSKEFAFLEFNSIEFATDFLGRQINVGIPLKIDSNDLLVSYGRDLSLLSRSLSGTLVGKITYWDSNYEFFEYPPHVTSVPEIPLRKDDSNLGVKIKRTAFGALPALSHTVPPKKIQLQLKSWTAKANSSQILNLNSNLPCNFIAEESVDKSKSKFVDITFLCCLLCDMKFNTENELLNHAQNSEDHAQKFEEYWKQSITEQKDSELYLDRAAERRDAFGVNEDEVKKIAKERQDSHSTIKSNTPQVPASSDESIGAKLMKKMGWKEGSGLGKDSDGIVEAIKAKTLENSSAGIGAANLITADEIKPKSYNDIVRGDRRKRFNE